MRKIIVTILAIALTGCATVRRTPQPMASAQPAQHTERAADPADPLTTVGEQR